MNEQQPLLEVRGLQKHYHRKDGIFGVLSKRSPPVRAVDDVSFTLERNEVIGIIGESGCGKTTLLETLMGVTDPTGGEIRYKGTPREDFTSRDWKRYKREVQIVFQDPFNSLDPKMTVEESILEPLKVHGFDRRGERVERALKRAELSPPGEYLSKTPDQLSGGEKQRVSIARALVLEPEVILADEPVSMLDVSTQAAILRLLAKLKAETDLSIIYISHDLSTVSYICDQINVMYLGRFVETAPTLSLLNDPKHPYSKALIQAIPIPDPEFGRERTRIDSSPPDPIELGEGCRFKDRCPERMDICDVTPESVDVGEHHEAACHLYYEHNVASTPMTYEEGQ